MLLLCFSVCSLFSVLWFAYVVFLFYFVACSLIYVNYIYVSVCFCCFAVCCLFSASCFVLRYVFFLKFRSLLSSLSKLHLCYCMLLLCFEVTSLFSGLVLSFCYAFVKFRSLLSIVCLLFCFILCFCFLSQYAPYFPISLLLYVMLCLSYVYCVFLL